MDRYLDFFALTIVVILLLLSSPVPAAEDEGWNFDVAVYGWLPNINIKDSSGSKSGLSRQDILDNLDPSVLGYVIASRGRFHAGLDLIYLNLSNKGNDELFPGFSLRETEITSILMNPFIGYEVYGGDRHSINVAVGARYFKLELDLDFQTGAPLPPGQSSTLGSDSVWDAMIGLNGRYELSDKWYLRYFGTVGGGQSDLVWSYAGTVGYQFQRFDVERGWRDMHYEFDSDSDFQRIDFPGPYIGATFSF